MFHSFIAMYSLFLAFINKDSPAQTHCDQVAWFVTSKNHYLDAKRQESLDQVPKLVSAPNSPNSASTKAQGCRRERGLKDSAVAKPGTKKKKKEYPAPLLSYCSKDSTRTTHIISPRQKVLSITHHWQLHSINFPLQLIWGHRSYRHVVQIEAIAEAQELTALKTKEWEQTPHMTHSMFLHFTLPFLTFLWPASESDPTSVERTNYAHSVIINQWFFSNPSLTRDKPAKTNKGSSF